MSKVLTFSRVFPAYHVRRGEPTYFVEKFLQSLNINIVGIDAFQYFERLNPHLPESIIDAFVRSLLIGHEHDKHHTIRSGHRFKAGDWFSPRVWSGKPYASKQIQFAPDIQVKKTWGIDIEEDGCVFINGKLYAYPNSDHALEPLAANDGLSVPDLFCWFKNGPIKDHQIICWSDQVEY